MRNLQELLSVYRAIRQEHEDSMRRAYEDFQNMPEPDLLDEDDGHLEDEDEESEDELLDGEYEALTQRVYRQQRWSQYIQPIYQREREAFAFFSAEEMKTLEKYKNSLVTEAYALCLELQANCPRLFKDSFDTDDLWKVEHYYKVQFHAMERLNRHWSAWEHVACLINDTQKLAEQSSSEPIN